jgi:chromosome segregation ATPase
MTDNTTISVNAVSVSADGISYNMYGGVESVTISASKLLEIKQRLADLETQLAEKTDRVNTLWIENQALLKQLAKNQRRVEMLRAVAEAAAGYNRALITLNKSKSQEDADIAYQWLYKWERTAQAAIDGGAMEE